MSDNGAIPQVATSKKTAQPERLLEPSCSHGSRIPYNVEPTTITANPTALWSACSRAKRRYRFGTARPKTSKFKAGENGICRFIPLKIVRCHQPLSTHPGLIFQSGSTGRSSLSCTHSIALWVYHAAWQIQTPCPSMPLPQGGSRDQPGDERPRSDSPGSSVKKTVQPEWLLEPANPE